MLINRYDAVDLFAGPGGWDVAARELGLATVEADVRTLDPLDYDTPGFIASPPCQTFSAAGGGAGRKALDTVIAGVRILLAGEPLPEYEDERTALVLEPLRWILARHRAGNPYRWIALEQVPPVLPVWEEYAHVLREVGYGVATGNLHAEEYGVPQTRKRAILVARLGRGAALPTPTHARYRKGSDRNESRLGLAPWVSMADALGWGMTARPLVTMTLSGSTNFIGGSGSKAAIAHEMESGAWAEPTVAVPGDSTWVYQRPSPTIVGSFAPDVVASPGYRKAGDGPRQSQPGSIRVTTREAGILQSFPADYPWQGSRTAQFRQIGNAIPPALARAVLRATTSERAV